MGEKRDVSNDVADGRKRCKDLVEDVKTWWLEYDRVHDAEQLVVRFCWSVLVVKQLWSLVAGDSCLVVAGVVVVVVAVGAVRHWQSSSVLLCRKMNVS